MRFSTPRVQSRGIIVTLLRRMRSHKMNQRTFRIPGLGDLPMIGLLHLAVVYVVWGSTYLAIRIAVEGPHGFPPFMLGAARMLLGGGILLTWLVFAKKRVRLDQGEWIWAILSGILLWTGGNGMVMFAERYQASGYSALVMGMVPIWVALTELVQNRRASGILWAGLGVGVVGLVILTLPGFQGPATDAVGIVSLIMASGSWAAGLVLQRRKLLRPNPVVSSAWQQLFGGGGFFCPGAVHTRDDSSSWHHGVGWIWVFSGDRVTPRVHLIHYGDAAIASYPRHHLFVCQSLGRGAFRRGRLGRSDHRKHGHRWTSSVSRRCGGHSW